MASVPLQSGFPTLIPNFDQPTVTAPGVVSMLTAAQLASVNPRTPASAALTLSGTVTTGNTITLTLTCGTLPGGSLAMTYTIQSSDTLVSIAQELATLINSNATAQNAQIYATNGTTPATDTEVIVNWTGPVGNFAVLSVGGTGAALATLTPSSGALSGGAGLVIPTSNFNATFNGSTFCFWYGKPVAVDYTLLSALVAQGMPIV